MIQKYGGVKQITNVSAIDETEPIRTLLLSSEIDADHRFTSQRAIAAAEELAEMIASTA